MVFIKRTTASYFIGEWKDDTNIVWRVVLFFEAAAVLVNYLAIIFG